MAHFDEMQKRRYRSSTSTGMLQVPATTVGAVDELLLRADELRYQEKVYGILSRRLRAAAVTTGRS